MRTAAAAAVITAMFLQLPAMASEDPTAIFADGNRAYLNGDYERAAELYRRLLDLGIMDADVYYNLANAYYRQGKLGLSILFYEKALKLEPGDDAARFNLELARKRLVDRVDSAAGGEPGWHRLLGRMAIDWLAWPLLVLVWVCSIIGVARLLARTEARKRVLKWLNVPLWTMAIILGLLFAGRMYLHEKVHYGIVLEREVRLLEGPDRNAGVLVELHEGLKVRLLAEAGGFVRVKLANGVEGYLPHGSVGQI